MTWNLVIRCAGPSLALVSLYGTEQELVARSKLTLVWGDFIEYLGPRLETLKDRMKRSQKDFQ